MVVYNGYWNTVRKTIVGLLEDKNGKQFQVRLLVDSGATVSIILMHTLYMTRGEWDMGQTPKIILQGINAQSLCHMMARIKFCPGPHVSQSFRQKMNIRDDFGVYMNFHIQNEIEVFKTYKRNLPDDVGEAISRASLTLADPEQLAPGNDMLYIHGIIGEDQIHELDETIIQHVGNEGMKATRSKFGDILHGRSHYIKFPYGSNGLELKGGQDFALDNIAQYGILSEPLNDPDSSLLQRSYLQGLCE